MDMVSVDRRQRSRALSTKCLGCQEVTFYCHHLVQDPSVLYISSHCNAIQSLKNFRIDRVELY